MAAIECEGGKFKSRTSQGRKVKDGGERSRHAYLLEGENDKVLSSASQPGYNSRVQNAEAEIGPIQVLELQGWPRGYLPEV
jgi:hypothetical protein